MSENITCCILAAGFGERMGQIGKSLNKSLISINQKSAISRIIENFPSNTSFVIATGYRHDQVKRFLKISYPKLNIKFVKIKNFSGPKSGPGLSLLNCKKYLQKPFFFVSCDTLFHKNVVKRNLKYNFLGVGKQSQGFKDYCNLETQFGNVINIYDKLKPKKNYFNFSGLGFVYDFKNFWDFKINQIGNYKNFEISLISKLFLKKSKVKVLKMDWDDIGTEKKLSKVRKKYEKYDFSKPDEQIYIENKKVIKFHSNYNLQKQKYKKSLLNQNVFPKCKISKEFIYYPFQEGSNLYILNNPKIFSNYLSWLQKELWIKKKIPKKELYKTCIKFYKQKTKHRVDLFLKSVGGKDTFLKINNINYPHINKIMKMINYEKLSQTSIPTFIHGDLHFDNSIYNQKRKSFSLIDWRSDFAGKLKYGDKYYDLAKLYGGLLMDYSKIKKNEFSLKKNNNNYTYKFKSAINYKKYINIYENFLNKNNLDIKKIKTIVGLIFLNMSPLHQHPFDKLLFCLSKEYICQNLND